MINQSIPLLFYVLSKIVPQGTVNICNARVLDHEDKTFDLILSEEQKREVMTFKAASQMEVQEAMMLFTQSPGVRPYLDGNHIVTMPDGTNYDGELAGGDRQGFGKCFFKEGHEYVGQWIKIK